MLPALRISTPANAPSVPSQPNTQTDIANSTPFTNQIADIKNTVGASLNVKSEMSVSSSLMKRRLKGPGLKLNLPIEPKVMTNQVLPDFQKLEMATNKHSDSYTSVVSSRYPEIKTAVKTQIAITDETTGEPIPLPANYLQVADKNIAIRTQYPKNTELSIEQHLKMLMAEKPSALVVIASQNDIDGANLQNNPEKILPLYFSRDNSYGSINVKSEANGILKYADQINANSYKLTLTNGEQGITLPVIHITNWNDRAKIPTEALRELVKDINNKEGIPAIHCISGSGRAGTIVAAMQLEQPNNQYSAYKVVESLRNTGTPHMVQTQEQYRILTELEPKIV